MLSEFDIIRSCFDQPGLSATSNHIINQGIGDDCALITIPAGKSLAFSMDTLVQGVHFPDLAPAELVASRSLAVNLSDLAATGASPLVFTLALTIPESNENWLKSFAAGLQGLAAQYNCYLIGGDMSRGPLSVTIQVQGLVDEGKAILRNGARPSDKIYVTESLGSAGLALQLFDGSLKGLRAEEEDLLLSAFYKPVPRVKAAIAVADFVSAGIDISDGLLSDLGHICARSGVGAKVNLPDIPVCAVLEKVQGLDQGLNTALNSGDDYELILTVPPEKEDDFLVVTKTLPEQFTCIGEITETQGLVCIDESGNSVNKKIDGYKHFQEAS